MFSASGDNATFGIKAKYEVIYGNKYLFIMNMHNGIGSKLIYDWKSDLFLGIRQWNPRKLRIILQLWIPSNTTGTA